MLNMKLSKFLNISLLLLLLCSSCKKEEIVQTKLIDSDGNAYDIIILGDQQWIMQNFKGTKYRNGDPIPFVESGETWAKLSSGAYSYYDNISKNADVFGHIYNFYAINDSRNIAPSGWHVATNEDWIKLQHFLGGPQIAGGKLKSKGTSLWSPPNIGASNETSFTSLPGGYRNANGNFESLGLFSSYWTSTEEIPGRAWYYSLYYDDIRLESQLCNLSKEAAGQYVRLVKD